MKKKAKAFSPGHITGFFAIADTKNDPLEKGSLGAGFSIAHGVTSEVSPGRGVFINGIPREDAKVSKIVCTIFSRKTGFSTDGLQLNHNIDLPEGSGFGTSGAGALSLAYALNAYFDNPLSKVAAAQVAHLAEIECKTGLGTVIGEYAGGFEIRSKEGAPGIGVIDRFLGPEDLMGVFAILGPYPTPGMLSNQEIRTKINLYGKDHLKELPGASYKEFLSYSQEFAIKTGLCPLDLLPIVKNFDRLGLKSSMLMFGKVLFSLVEKDQVDWAIKLFNQSIPSAEILSSPIDFTGGRVLYD